jgi:hypothetical protein
MSDELTLDALLGRMARDELPWAQAWTTDFAEFAERFTLHDSRWVGLFLPTEFNDAVLAVEWDGYCQPEPLRTECTEGSPDSQDSLWPFLFIRVSDLHAVRHLGYEKPVGGRCICGEGYCVEEGVKVLMLDFCGGTVRLEFTGGMEFLALRRGDGRTLHLANVDPRPEPPKAERPWWRFW